MILPGSKIQVVKGGKGGLSIEYEIQEKEVYGAQYAFATEQLLVIVNTEVLKYPDSLKTEQAREEFHDMCILMAIASRLFSKDSANAVAAAQHMRLTMHLDEDTSQVTVYF